MGAMVKIHKLGLPEGYKFNFGEEADELSEYDIRDLKDLYLDEIFYWYTSGSYEGTGWMIARKDGLYGLFDLSHCSCFGPVECVNALDITKSLDELKSKLSDEVLVLTAELFKRAYENA
jgi:hypothetical protein